MREILYGRQPVYEAVRAGRREVFRVIVARGLARTGIVGEVLRLVQEAHAEIREVDRRELNRLGDEAHHQGLAVEVSGYPYLDLNTLWEVGQQRGEDPLLLLLDHVLDPQNLGSLLRSAEAAGAHGVVLPARRAALVTPAAVRASAGAAEHLHVAIVPNLVRALEWLKGQGLWIAGLEALPESHLHTQANLSGPLGLVVGSEGQGLTRLVREACDLLVRLPLYGRVSSLNAAVAGAIALYEVRRQRSGL